MRGEVALVLICIGLLAGGCKTYTAVPFDAGDGNLDVASDLSTNGVVGDGGFPDGVAGPVT